MRVRRVFLFSLCISLLLAGCDYLPVGFTPIGDIVQNPGSFEGKTIKVRGEVIEVVKLPMFEYKSYVLHDDSGEILVMTAGSLPPLHKKLAIKAQVKTMAIINEQSIGLRLVEEKKLPISGFGS